MLYTTLKTLKLSLWIDEADISKDEVLERIIKSVSRQFENYLWFSLEKKKYSQVLEKNFDYIIVSHFPVKNILKIVEKNSLKNLTYSRIDDQIIYIDENYFWAVLIEYEAWFDSLEEISDIENACLEMCSMNYNDLAISWAETNVKSKKIETLSKTYFSKEEMSAWIQMNFREVLDFYKKDCFNPLKI